MNNRTASSIEKDIVMLGNQNRQKFNNSKQSQRQHQQTLSKNSVYMSIQESKSSLYPEQISTLSANNHCTNKSQKPLNGSTEETKYSYLCFLDNKNVSGCNNISNINNHTSNAKTNNSTNGTSNSGVVNGGKTSQRGSISM
jgi:hypothetical protein